MSRTGDQASSLACIVTKILIPTPSAVRRSLETSSLLVLDLSTGFSLLWSHTALRKH
ncbi:rCG22076 [Rattus norvegicus]|uniref:RCG22076 n=1 Tax=Rattus norvegicus TaxID=10116 RepID=A6K3Y4_RAT|nr:rCG22076 [Rattus norvegicus]